MAHIKLCGVLLHTCSYEGKQKHPIKLGHPMSSAVFRQRVDPSLNSAIAAANLISSIYDMGLSSCQMWHHSNKSLSPTQT